MYSNTRDKILRLLEKQKQCRPSELIEALGITAAAVHRHLKTLVETKQIEKTGHPPLVFYKLVKPLHATKALPDIPDKIKNLIEDNYLYIDPQGHLEKGFGGFVHWAHKTKQDKNFLALCEEFYKIRTEANRFFSPQGFIEAKTRIDAIFENVFLTKLFYLDFYSLPKFGRTPLGQMILHAKQAQDKPSMQTIAQQSQTQLMRLIEDLNIQAIGWMPHSLPRKVSLLKELKKYLNFSLPTFDIVKAYSGELPIAQKSLSKLEERIQNARETIFLKSQNLNYDRVLLIDDAVGSGSTLNETAKKIREQTSVKEIYGFAFVGSYKGFEVIKEI